MGLWLVLGFVLILGIGITVAIFYAERMNKPKSKDQSDRYPYDPKPSEQTSPDPKPTVTGPRVNRHGEISVSDQIKEFSDDITTLYDIDEAANQYNRSMEESQKAKEDSEKSEPLSQSTEDESANGRRDIHARTKYRQRVSDYHRQRWAPRTYDVLSLDDATPYDQDDLELTDAELKKLIVFKELLDKKN